MTSKPARTGRTQLATLVGAALCAVLVLLLPAPIVDTTLLRFIPARSGVVSQASGAANILSAQPAGARVGRPKRAPMDSIVVLDLRSIFGDQALRSTRGFAITQPLEATIALEVRPMTTIEIVSMDAQAVKVRIRSADTLRSSGAGGMPESAPPVLATPVHLQLFGLPRALHVESLDGRRVTVRVKAAASQPFAATAAGSHIILRTDGNDSLIGSHAAPHLNDARADTGGPRE